MQMDFINDKPVAVLLGAGSIGTAILRRIAPGKIVLLGDINEQNLENTADSLRRSGYEVCTQRVDASDPESVRRFAERAAELGEVRYFIDTAGASPDHSSPERIVQLDLISAAIAIDEFGRVIARGGAGLIVASQMAYMAELSPETEEQLALTATKELSELPFVKNDAVRDRKIAYAAAKRCNQLRVRTAAATSWGERGARINTISPGLTMVPAVYNDFNAPGSENMHMIKASSARRVGTADDIAAAAAFLLSDAAALITGTDLLIDGGFIAAARSGRYV